MWVSPMGGNDACGCGLWVGIIPVGVSYGWELPEVHQLSHSIQDTLWATFINTVIEFIAYMCTYVG